MTRGRRRLGAAGETHAASHLERLGYRILARNWRGQGGEIDLVATAPGEERTIVFVEVKTRHSTDWGHPGEAVDRRKQGRIRRTAAEFLETERPQVGDVRFDVVEVVVVRGVAHVDHIEDAF